MKDNYELEREVRKAPYFECKEMSIQRKISLTFICPLVNPVHKA